MVKGSKMGKQMVYSEQMTQSMQQLVQHSSKSSQLLALSADTVEEEPVSVAGADTLTLFGDCVGTFPRIIIVVEYYWCATLL